MRRLIDALEKASSAAGVWQSVHPAIQRFLETGIRPDTALNIWRGQAEHLIGTGNPKGYDNVINAATATPGKWSRG